MSNENENLETFSRTWVDSTLDFFGYLGVLLSPIVAIVVIGLGVQGTLDKFQVAMMLSGAGGMFLWSLLLLAVAQGLAYLRHANNALAALTQHQQRLQPATHTEASPTSEPVPVEPPNPKV